MERDMSIRITTDDLCSCNGCGVKNYVSNFEPDVAPAEVLYDVKIGIMVSHLCPDCLCELARMIDDVLCPCGRDINAKRPNPEGCLDR